MAPDGSRAYVTCRTQAPAVIDAVGRRVWPGSISAAGRWVAVHPSGSPVYVADLYGKRVQAVDPALAASRPPPRSGIRRRVSRSRRTGSTLIVADRDDNQISLGDTATLTRIATVKVGTHPFGVAVDAEGRRAYTANVEFVRRQCR